MRSSYYFPVFFQKFIFMKKQIICCLILFCHMLTYAQSSENESKRNKPGNPSLVSSDADLQKLMQADKGNYKYKVEDYFATPELSDFHLSPNGKFLAFKERDVNGRSHVMAKELNTGKTTLVLEEKEHIILGYFWATNDRLLYIMDSGGDENYHIYGVNADGSNNKDITPYPGVRTAILKYLPDQKEFLIIQMNKDNKDFFEPYKININTGAAVKLYDNNDPANTIETYDFDKDGNLRGFGKMNGSDVQNYYKPSGEKDFKLLNTVKWTHKFQILAFNDATKNPDDAYVLTNLGGDKAKIVLFDLKENKVLKEIASDPDYDLLSINISRKRKGEIDYISYIGEKKTFTPVSNQFKKLYNNLEKQLGSKQFEIAGKSDNEDKYLIKVSSDRLYGRFYLYEAKTAKTTLLVDLMPQLKENDMAEMHPITFKSRDGLMLHGYITLPKEAQAGKRVPMIVNPHGGPHYLRDVWGFNPEAQLFASRGYATLQVNFRVSEGYGVAFIEAGFKQPGRKIQDDLEDGINYAVSQGWADKDKIGIYGGSHGGYATLMGLVRTPDLYKAGVDYVGISNIATFFEAFPKYWSHLIGPMKEVWYDIDDPEEATLAKTASALYNIDKIKAPLFVVQGANDPRVKIAESDQIVDALRKKGLTVPYMVKYDEGHGFIREENQIDFYKAMLGFFAQHLK